MSSYVFVDSRVQNYDLLLASLAPDTHVVILDSTQDGLTQIAQALEGVTDLDAIHIISHGSEGALYLGDTVLTSDSLAEYTSELERIGAALSEQGDILLYGCEVANGITGQGFIENLALYTDADVAASTDTTGSTALGGDWILEAGVGALETLVLFDEQTIFDGLLIIVAHLVPGTPGNDTLIGTYDSRGFAWPNDYVEYSQARENYTVTATVVGGDGTVAISATVTGPEGFDTLIGIELIDFLDQNIDLGGRPDPEQGTGDPTFNLGGLIDTIFAAIDYTLQSTDLAAVSNLTLIDAATTADGNSLANILTGNDSNNVLDGAGGNDTLLGGDGNDTLRGDAGDDSLNGGTGIDTASYAGAAAVSVSLLVALQQNTVGAGLDTLSGIENLLGSSHNDTLTGNSAANLLDGSVGNDIMTGGDGSDTYYVRDNGDSVIETNATASTGGTDLVYSYLSTYTLGANVENGRIISSGAANLTGNTLSNLIYAGKGDNVLNGSTGTDTVSFYYGVNGTTGVTVSLVPTTAQATGGSGSDTLSGFEHLYGSNNADKLTGSTGANKLTGYAGNDTLDGGTGNDTLTGGNGKDSLTGGSGNDIFDYNTLLESGITNITWDVINDFVIGQDKIDLRTLDANTATATNDVFTFIGSSSFSAPGQVRYASGVLYGSNDADSTAEFAIQLVGIATLATSDFLL